MEEYTAYVPQLTEVYVEIYIKRGKNKLRDN